jgi:hypothetical protein
MRAKIETRRVFLRGFLGMAGGTAAAALSACSAAAGSEIDYRTGGREAPEVVSLRPWMRYENALPGSVPAVRLGESAGSIYEN